MGEFAARVLAMLSRPRSAMPETRYRSPEAYARSEYDLAAYLLPLLARFAPEPRTVAIDLGSGYGGATERYAETLSIDGMIGIDFNREKVSEATRLWSRSRFVPGSATHLPFADASVDCIISHDGFEHFMVPEAVLREAHRVLRPGGRFFISFSPYFTTKGPHLEHYIPLPYAHLLLSRTTVARAAEIVGTRQMAGIEASGREDHMRRLKYGLWQARECINEMSLRRWERLLVASEGFSIVAYRKYVGRNLHRPLLLNPLTQELVASVFAVLEKQDGAPITASTLQRAQAVDIPDVIYHH